GGLDAVGEERVVPPDREQFRGVGPVTDPAHDQPGGDWVWRGGDRGEDRYLGDLGVADPFPGLRIGHRARVADRDPGVLAMLAIALVTVEFFTKTRENRAPAARQACTIAPW